MQLLDVRTAIASKVKKKYPAQNEPSGINCKNCCATLHIK